MNRRTFLKNLGLAGVAVAAPKFIFDVGKNLYRMPEVRVYQERLWVAGSPEPMAFSHSEPYEEMVFDAKKFNAYMEGFVRAYHEAPVVPGFKGDTHRYAIRFGGA